MRDELDRFKHDSASATKKSGEERSAAPVPGSDLQATMRATVFLRHKEKKSVLSRLETFRWEDVPGIRAQVRAKNGDVPFLIAVESSDGSGCELSFHPPRSRR